MQNAQKTRNTELYATCAGSNGGMILILGPNNMMAAQPALG